MPGWGVSAGEGVSIGTDAAKSCNIVQDRQTYSPRYYRNTRLEISFSAILSLCFRVRPATVCGAVGSIGVSSVKGHTKRSGFHVQCKLQKILTPLVAYDDGTATIILVLIVVRICSTAGIIFLQLVWVR